MVKVVLAFADAAVQVVYMLALEGEVSADERVEHDTERPEIRLLSIFALDDFWRHVVRSACHCGQIALLFRCLGETEVDESHMVVFCDHDVVRLDISVHDVQCVAVIDCLEQCLHVLASLPLSKRLILLLADLVI